jgi:hypothetical protein
LTTATALNTNVTRSTAANASAKLSLRETRDATQLG